VLVLHTADGVTVHEHALALELHRAGFATMVLPYSRRTSGRVLTDETACGDIMRIVDGGFDTFRQLPHVLPHRVAVMGLSLGGYFALRLASRATPPLPAAAVVWYGVYPAALSLIDRLHLPTLVVQGTRDAPSFVASARSLAAAAPDRGELLMYRDAPHRFDVVQPGSRAAREGLARTVAWLGRHLGQHRGPSTSTSARVDRE
jgi:dienelactone hydrolase